MWPCLWTAQTGRNMLRDPIRGLVMLVAVKMTMPKLSLVGLWYYKLQSKGGRLLDSVLYGRPFSYELFYRSGNWFGKWSGPFRMHVFSNVSTKLTMYGSFNNENSKIVLALEPQICYNTISVHDHTWLSHDLLCQFDGSMIWTGWQRDIRG